MSKKHILVILVIISLVFLFGCAKGDTTETGERFQGTNEGVSLAFTSGKPLSQFSRGDSVPVEVILKNGGEHDIKAGDIEVKLFGVNLKTFGLADEYKQVNTELHGVNQFFTEPGETRVSFDSLKYSEDIVSRSYSFTLRAKACYNYQTNLESSICVGSTESAEAGGERVCVVDGEKVKSGDVSSAPIQITSLTEKLFGKDKLQIKFVVKNQGSGEVYLPETNCALPGEEGQVKVDVNPDDIQCFFDDGENDKGIISLDNGAKTVTCSRTVVVGEENYEDKINIKLNYKYVDRASTTFNVFS